MGSRRLRELIAWVAVGALVGALAAAGAPAAASPTEQRLDASVRYLQSVQNADGGFGGRAGAESDPIFTSWAALALAAAGINPRDQALPGGRDAIAYLRRGVGRLSVTTDFERTLMVATAAGVDPRAFGGRDLVAPILARQLPDGSFPQAPGGAPTVNATAFAVIALAQVGEVGLEGPIQRAATWLEQVADPDGGYSWVPRAAGDADMTAAVVQALRAAGRAGTETEWRALAFLRLLQNDDGGFPMTRGGESNSPSTAWALQALWAVGEDPRSWAGAGGTPLDFLASMQQADGSVRQSATSDPNRVWVTAYAVPALAGRELPIAPVPRRPVEHDRARESEPTHERRRTPTPRDVRSDARASGGQAGEGDRPAEGVVYGGGGEGAGLFSKPRPDGGGDRDPAAAQGGSGAGGGHDRRGGGGAGTGARPRPAARRPASDVDGVVVRAGAPGSGAVRAPRMRSSGGGERRSGGLVVLGGVGLLALAGALVERRRP